MAQTSWFENLLNKKMTRGKAISTGAKIIAVAAVGTGSVACDPDRDKILNSQPATPTTPAVPQTDLDKAWQALTDAGITITPKPTTGLRLNTAVTAGVVGIVLDELPSGATISGTLKNGKDLDLTLGKLHSSANVELNQVTGRTYVLKVNQLLIDPPNAQKGKVFIEGAGSLRIAAIAPGNGREAPATAVAPARPDMDLFVGTGSIAFTTSTSTVAPNTAPNAYLTSNAPTQSINVNGSALKLQANIKSSKGYCEVKGLGVNSEVILDGTLSAGSSAKILAGSYGTGSSVTVNNADTTLGSALANLAITVDAASSPVPAKIAFEGDIGAGTKLTLRNTEDPSQNTGQRIIAKLPKLGDNCSVTVESAKGTNAVTKFVGASIGANNTITTTNCDVSLESNDIYANATISVKNGFLSSCVPTSIRGGLTLDYTSSNPNEKLRLNNLLAGTSAKANTITTNTPVDIVSIGSSTNIVAGGIVVAQTVGSLVNITTNTKGSTISAESNGTGCTFQVKDRGTVEKPIFMKTPNVKSTYIWDNIPQDIKNIAVYSGYKGLGQCR